MAKGKNKIAPKEGLAYGSALIFYLLTLIDEVSNIVSVGGIAELFMVTLGGLGVMAGVGAKKKKKTFDWLVFFLPVPIIGIKLLSQIQIFGSSLAWLNNPIINAVAMIMLIVGIVIELFR